MNYDDDEQDQRRRRSEHLSFLSYLPCDCVHACTCRLLKIFLNRIDSILFCLSIFSNDYSGTTDSGVLIGGAICQNHPMFDVTSGWPLPPYFEGKNA